MDVKHWHQVYGHQSLASNNSWASNISASEVNHPYEFWQASQCDGVYHAKIRKVDSPLTQRYLMPIKCMGVKHWCQIIYERQISLRQK